MLRDARTDEPFRLLWLIDSLALGGAEALTLSFARAVDPSLVRLRVVCLKAIGGNPFEAELRDAGVPVSNLGADHLRDTRAFARLLRLLRVERTEWIHAHLEYASIWGAVAARLTGTPCVASLHVAPSDPAGWRASLRRRIRVRCLNRWTRESLAVSGWLRDAWVEAGLDAGAVRVVPNGIDCEAVASRSRSRLRARCGWSPEARVVVSVAALRPEKGLDVLLDAAPAILSREPRARFLVVGEGAVRESLERRCRELGVARAFRWAGFRTDVRNLLPACDVFVLPTREDAFPTAILEAMAAGLPVVASRVGGVPEMVEAGGTGVLVPPGSASRLADAVVGLLADRRRARGLGTVGRRRVREEFSTEAWMGRLEEVYGRALGRVSGTESVETWGAA